MQRGVNLDSGIRLAEVAQDTRGRSEGRMGIPPEELVLSTILPAATYVASGPRSPPYYPWGIHKVCSGWVSWGLPISKLAFPGILYLQMISSRPPFTHRQVTREKRGDAPVPWRQQNVPWMALFRHFLWGWKHWWVTEDWQSKIWGQMTMFAHFTMQKHCRFL